jgi:hypothetical protein
MVSHVGRPRNWLSNGVMVGIGFYSIFVYCPRVEMSFRCRWVFPRKEKCLLDFLQSVFQYQYNYKNKEDMSLWSPEKVSVGQCGNFRKDFL